MPIIFSHLNYVYSPKTPLEYGALKDINLEIKDNSFTMLVGHTGSGKSTLAQQINALLTPTSGEVNVNGIIVDNNVKKLKNIKELRKGVGLVFQFPVLVHDTSWCGNFVSPLLNSSRVKTSG